MKRAAASLAATLGHAACGSAAPGPATKPAVANATVLAPLCSYGGPLVDTPLFAAGGKRVAWISDADGDAQFETTAAGPVLSLEARSAGWTVRGHGELAEGHPLGLKALTELTPGLLLRAGARPSLLAAEPGTLRIGPTPDALDDAWHFLADPIITIGCDEVAPDRTFDTHEGFTSDERRTLGLDDDDDDETRYLLPNVTHTMHDAASGAVLARYRHDEATLVDVIAHHVAAGTPWSRIALASAEVIVVGWVADAAFESPAIGHGSGLGHGSGYSSGRTPRMRCTLTEALDILIAPAGAPDGDQTTLVSIGTAAAGASFVARGRDPSLPILDVLDIDAEGISPQGQWLLRPTVPPRCE